MEIKTVKLTNFPQTAVNDIIDYCHKNNHRFWSIRFDSMNGMWFESPIADLAAYVAKKYGA